MSIARICSREVDTAEMAESIEAVARRMAQRAMGTLVVLNDEKEPIGILTDRDIVTRVIARGKLASEARVGDVMTPLPKTVEAEAPIESALSLMRSGCHRRLPVVDRDRRLVGIVSIDDILRLLSEEFGYVGDLLKREAERRVL